MKSHDVRQLDAFSIPLPTRGPVAQGIVNGQPDFLSALRLAIAASGLDDKQIYSPLDIDHAQWSRIRGGSAFFPMRKYEEFRQLVGNDILLQWLAFRSGYELKALSSDLERENARLRDELAQERRDRETILRFVKEARL